MAAFQNPFTPSFGKMPPHMAGREAAIKAITSAFKDNPNSPSRNSLIVGARGTGKTVLLARVGEEVASYGWAVVNVTAGPGMLEDILQRALEAAGKNINRKSGIRVTAVNVAQVLGIEWEYKNAQEANWRTRMNGLLDSLASRAMGLLITVDEVRATEPEMIECATTYQQFVRENRAVGLLMAGLPKNVDALLSDESSSFLRRADRFDLGRIDDEEVRSAFQQTVEQGGRTIDPAALDYAVDAIGGYAYLMQLVGFRIWEVDEGKERIDLVQARIGVDRAQRELTRKVFDVSFRDLSKGDKKFLASMLAGDQTGDLDVIADRMGKKRNYAYNYRTRLINQGILDEAPDGTLEFVIPGLSEYLANKLL